MTLAEKIFARHFVTDLSKDQVGVEAVKPGDAGFVRTDIRFSHEYVTPMAAIFYEKLVGDEPINDPSSVYLFQDHLTFLDDVMPPERKAAGLLDLAHELVRKQEAFAKKQGIRLHGAQLDRQGSEGICHSVILQSYALPGQIIIGSDSHTPHSGAVGAIAFGVGTTDIFNSWITKDVRVRVPEQVRVRVSGRKPDNITAKDFMLAILRTDFVRNGDAIGKIVEYTGEAVADLNIDERATMTNMAAEVGAFTGIVAADQKTVEFLVERGIPRAEAERMCEGMTSDPDAEYSLTIDINASELRPMIATPGDPGNGMFIDELAGSGEDRHRLRRVVHGGQEGRPRYVRARLSRSAGARAARASRREVLYSIRFGRGKAVLRGARLHRGACAMSARKSSSRVAGLASTPAPV